MDTIYISDDLSDLMFNHGATEAAISAWAEDGDALALDQRLYNAAHDVMKGAGLVPERDSVRELVDDCYSRI